MEKLSEDQMRHIQGVIEALLFVNEKPVMLSQIKKVLETVSPGDIKAAIARLQKEHEERKSGMNIVEIAEGYQMLSNPQYVSYLKKFYKSKHKERLSKPALETLAIVAYKQPVTRQDVEMVRGVNSDGVVNHLLEKELIKVEGRKDVPGKPFLYGTTKQFMEYFGLKSLENLPDLEEFENLEPKDEESEGEGEKEDRDKAASEDAQETEAPNGSEEPEESKEAEEKKEKEEESEEPVEAGAKSAPSDGEADGEKES